MLSVFRRLKAAYSFYNYFHRKELVHNESLYKKYGIRKKYYSPISSKDFAHLNNKVNQQSAQQAITETEFYKNLSPENQESARHYDDNGYIIIKNYLSQEKVATINTEIERLMREQKIKFNTVNKLMFAIHQSSLLRGIGEQTQLKDFLGVLLDGEAVLFQSINFIMGSEQHTHSDSIHMTTYPLGGLLGVWIALDDITTENGPLHYYPGSHKLPCYLNSDYDNEGNEFLIGEKSYKAYEEMIENKIQEKGLKKEVFLANKGDLLIWHANLFHGGEPHHDKNLTRKSMVLHYFKKDSICYHEITQRPALIKTS